MLWHAFLFLGLSFFFHFLLFSLVVSAAFCFVFAAFIQV
jgi:hypothetical protein